MSCWVVPAIAAELWGVTVEHVLARVRAGTIESRREHGFTFVHATPAACHSHFTARREGPPPPTFVPVRRVDDLEPAEEAALANAAMDFDWVGDLEGPPEEIAPLCGASPAPAHDDELPPLDEEEDDRPLPPRDAFRAAVARRRRPPLAA
jgi:hypothetical protein